MWFKRKTLLTDGQRDKNGFNLLALMRGGGGGRNSIGRYLVVGGGWGWGGKIEEGRSGRLTLGMGSNIVNFPNTLVRAQSTTRDTDRPVIEF